MRERRAAALLAAALIAVAPPPARAAPADGKPLYAGCVACHGARGEGVTAVGAPGIAGLSAAYLERQLRAFASGARGAAAGDSQGAAMRAATAGIRTDAQRTALAAYVASLPRVDAPSKSGDNANGRNYFNALCSACHASNGAGNESLGAPRLAGQSAAYIERQLAAFRSGRRGAATSDREGGQMRSIANMLPDAATLHDVAQYSATLAGR